MRNKFQPGHPKYGGKKKGVNKQTVWVLESLKEHGVDYTEMLANALKQAVAGDEYALGLVNALAKLAPHIANKPKEVVGMEGIEGLVITPYEPKKPGKDASKE